MLHLSDLHLLPAADARLLGVDTAETLEAVLRAARAVQGEANVDAVVISGDIAHAGGQATYARARAAVARWFDAPTLWLPGNHDESLDMAASFPAHRELTLGDWLLLGVDTHVDGAEGGFVAEAELERIARVLAASTARFVLAFGHHPVVEVGTPWLDGGRVANAGALLDRLGADARVRGYAFGHIHHAAQYDGAPWPLWSAPSTCFAFAQGGTRFCVTPGPPGCRWFELDDDGAVESRVVRADDCIVAPDLATFRSRSTHTADT